MKKTNYVKIDKNFLEKQYYFLQNKINAIESLKRDNNYPLEEVKLLRSSFQDLSFIISKTLPL